MTPSPTARTSSMQRSVALVAVSCVLFSAYLAYSESWQQMRMLHLARMLGWVAIAHLLTTLSVSPIAKLVAQCSARQLQGVASLRRTLGIATALLASLHSVIAYAAMVHPQPYLLWSWPHLHLGSLALATLLMLFATSFSRITRVLHLHAWKELHKLAYVAAALSFCHAALSPWASRTRLLWAFGMWIALRSTSWAVSRWPRAKTTATLDANQSL